MESGGSVSSRRCSFCGTATASDAGDEPTHDAVEGAAVAAREEPTSDPDRESARKSDADSPPGTFCSVGCRRLHDAFESTERERAADADAESTGTADAARNVAKSDERTEAPQADDGIVRTYFRIDGTHAAHDEAYLESIATGHEGVVDASASYVTESVRVDHDPDRISPETLEETLTGLGFTAFRRDRGRDGGEPNGAARDDRSVGTDVSGQTHRDREVSGFRKRRADDFLEMRYVLGVVFGSFLLVPYAVLFYPASLAELTDWAALSIYGGSMRLDWGVLPLFLVVTGAILYLTGKPLLRGASLAITLRRPNAHLLATLPIVAAYVYGAVAVLVGRSDLYFDLTIVVAATVMGAIYWEATVKRDAVSRLTALTRAAVSEARRLEPDGSTTVVPTGSLDSGDRILVRQGERIPVDGTLADGNCTVAEALLTGESLPRERTGGDALVGGSTVTSGSAVVAVGANPTSRLDGLTRRVWDLQSATHGASTRADELARQLLPLVVGSAAVAAAVTLLGGAGPTTALRQLLLTLIVASPWALAFATPVSVATSLQEAARMGVVVFDETVFDRLRHVDTVVFDKTGTLTSGEMSVRDATGPAEALGAAAALERRAAHPAADAIVDAFLPASVDPDSSDPGDSDGGAPADDPTVTDAAGGPGSDDRLPQVDSFETYPTGVSGEVDGEATLVGHPSLFESQGWNVGAGIEETVESVRAAGHLPVVVGRNGRAAGVVTVGDRPRESWVETIDSLADRGVDVIVLTGDDASATDFLTGHDGVSAVYANVPPTGKTQAIRQLSTAGRVAMIGDGTNDAPALAAADMGIALGGGTALAADAADLAIADDDLAGVDRAFALADRARRRRRGTLGLALSYNAIAIPAALAGLVNPLVTMAGIVVATGSILTYASHPVGIGRD